MNLTEFVYIVVFSIGSSKLCRTLEHRVTEQLGLGLFKVVA